jgi:hypothetical protein
MASGSPRRRKVEDGFSDRLQYLIDRGLMASMSGGTFKNFIVSEVQEYSREAALEGEPHSALFFSLCDLMLDGHFAKIPENALKLHVLIAIYKYMPLDESALENMTKMSGLSESDVAQAMEYLEENGWLFSAVRKPSVGSIADR